GVGGPMRIRTVLCPIDFSTLDPAEIGVGLEVCRAFGARLVLHHNVAAAEPGFSRAWEWEKTHYGEADRQPEAERHLRTLVERIGREVRAEGLVTSGPVGAVVLSLAEQLEADLVVLGSHGWSTQDHASVTERLVDESPCPVLTFDGRAGRPAFRLRTQSGKPLPVVVPTDLTPGSAAAVGYACGLARALPLRLDLLHVIDPAHCGRDAQRNAHAALDAMVPPDLVGRVSSHVRTGPAATAIIEYVAESVPAFAVLGEHARGLLRRVLTRDTTREVVHRVGCPVWVVPPGVQL
ncbi:MAG: universal stress protein, partial [Candidatus Binatia bacterium]